MSDLINRQAAIDAVLNLDVSKRVSWMDAVIDEIDACLFIRSLMPLQNLLYFV